MIPQLNQVTLPLEIPQVFLQHYHIGFQQRSLPQLHYMHQVTQPVDIPPFSINIPI